MTDFVFEYGFEFRFDSHVEHADAKRAPLGNDYMAIARRYTAALEKWTRARLAPLARALTRDYAAMRAQVPGLRTDRDSTDPEVTVGLFLEDWDEAVDRSRPLHERNYRALNVQNAAAVNNQSISVRGIRAYDPASETGMIINSAVMRSLERMRNVGPDFVREAMLIISEGHEKGWSAERVGELLEDRVGIEGRRARFVARNEMGNANAALTETRQTANGVVEYVWRTSKDERVVGNPGGRYPVGSAGHMNHHEREGGTFQWSRPPGDGHPGMAYNCRCTAEPVFPPLEAEETTPPVAPVEPPAPPPAERIPVGRSR